MKELTETFESGNLQLPETEPGKNHLAAVAGNLPSDGTSKGCPRTRSRGIAASLQKAGGWSDLRGAGPERASGTSKAPRGHGGYTSTP